MYLCMFVCNVCMYACMYAMYVIWASAWVDVRMSCTFACMKYIQCIQCICEMHTCTHVNI